MDLVEAAVSLAVNLDRLRILNASWMMYAGNQTPEMKREMAEATGEVKLAIAALVGTDG